MNAPLRNQEIAIDPLEVFRARAEARALLWHCCEFSLSEAVDVLQRDAVASGLVHRIGQDGVQRILADAFHKFRPELRR
jgi:hypothetical protein